MLQRHADCERASLFERAERPVEIQRQREQACRGNEQDDKMASSCHRRRKHRDEHGAARREQQPRDRHPADKLGGVIGALGERSGTVEIGPRGNKHSDVTHDRERGAENAECFDPESSGKENRDREPDDAAGRFTAGLPDDIVQQPRGRR